jgi:hypothetical protein
MEERRLQELEQSRKLVMETSFKGHHLSKEQIYTLGFQDGEKETYIKDNPKYSDVFQKEQTIIGADVRLRALGAPPFIQYDWESQSNPAALVVRCVEENLYVSTDVIHTLAVRQKTAHDVNASLINDVSYKRSIRRICTEIADVLAQKASPQRLAQDVARLESVALLIKLLKDESHIEWMEQLEQHVCILGQTLNTYNQSYDVQ